jgi:hypothetical protein
MSEAANETSGSQATNNQSAGNNDTNTGNNAGGGQQNTEPTVQTVPLDEFNKAKNGQIEVLKKYKDQSAELNTLKAELEKMKHGQAQNAPDLEKTKAMYEGLLETSKTEQAKLKDELDQLRVFGKVKNVAVKNNAINPELVEMLVRKHLIKDEKGNYVIKDNTMNPKTRKMVTLEELTVKILEENPYLKKPSGIKGADSSASTAAAGSNKVFSQKEIADMTIEEYKKNQPAILKQLAAQR